MDDRCISVNVGAVYVVFIVLLECKVLLLDNNFLGAAVAEFHDVHSLLQGAESLAVDAVDGHSLISVSGGDVADTCRLIVVDNYAK